MEQLGINVSSLVIQIINFVVLAAILTKFLYQPVIKKLDERQKQIEANTRLQESLAEQQQQVQHHRDQILNEANQEARKIISDAKSQAKIHHEEQLKKTELEIQKLKDKFDTYQSQAKHNLEIELQEKSISLAKSLARKVLSESLTKSAHVELIDEAIKKFKTS